MAERWIGSCGREILDHVITLDEEHLRRLIRDYIGYHQEDRIHDSLDKDTPNRRLVEQAGRRRQRDFTAASGWAPPSLHVAESGMRGASVGFSDYSTLCLKRTRPGRSSLTSGTMPPPRSRAAPANMSRIVLAQPPTPPAQQSRRNGKRRWIDRPPLRIWYWLRTGEPQRLRESL
jgi:hypothetical protein